MKYHEQEKESQNELKKQYISEGIKNRSEEIFLCICRNELV
jgi:hypothetical protein